jgi:hypothetical protein
MAEVTKADREKARVAIKASSPEVYVDEYVIDGELPPLIETIAAALAEEREKARAPFLALADKAERQPDGYHYIAATMIRRAAEEG